MIRSHYLLVASLLAASLLVGCSSNNDDENMQDNGGGTPPPPAPVRGTLTQSPPTRLASLSTADLLGKLAGSDAVKEIVTLVGDPSCTVDVHSLQYNTVGGASEATVASAALMVPSGSSAECQGSRPILLYAHGTSTDRAYNIADLNNSENAEGLLIAATFAAHGYIVVAPNYAGYDTSTLPYHPYLNADQSSKDMIDALAAARSALPTSFVPGTTASDKLFITGYSQGGHVAMATHAAMQAAGSAVTASAPLSGPYALAAFGDALFYGQVNDNAPVVVTMTIVSYQHAYGNIYASTTDVFEAKYATGVDTLLPSTLPRSTLYDQGKLPRQQLFSSTPPSDTFAAYTPPTTPAAFASLFARGFGTDNLVTNAYRLAYLNDAQANPDGGFPTTTSGIPAAAPATGFRKALRANDLRNWTPTSPLLLCAGNADPTVFYLNTQLLQGYWASTGANPPVTILDIDSSKTDGDPYADLKTGFATFKDLIAAAAVAAGASDGGAQAVADAYHATLVAPFCLAAARSKFDSL